MKRFSLIVVFLGLITYCLADYPSTWILKLNTTYIIDKGSPTVFIYEPVLNKTDTLKLYRDICGGGKEKIYIQIRTYEDSSISTSFYNVDMCNPIIVNLQQYYNMKLQNISIWYRTEKEFKMKQLCEVRFDQRGSFFRKMKYE